MGKTRRTLVGAAAVALAVAPAPALLGSGSTDRASPPTAPVGAASEPFEASSRAVRFVALGDTGRGDDGQAAVGAAIAQKCRTSGCDFVLLLGDNVYDSGVTSVDDVQFRTKFEEPYAAVDAPFWAVLGNHDYGGGGLGHQFDRAAFEIAYTQRSAKWKMPAAYYRFRRGDVELFALDTNMQLYGDDAAQRADVKRWLRESSATWTIAFGHHPYRSNGVHGNAGSYDGLTYVPYANGEGVRTFAEDVFCGRVDLYLAGHDHSRQWLRESCNGTGLIVSGAGAKGTALPGSNPTYFQSSELGFVYVVVEDRALTAELVHVSGTIELSRTLRK